MPLSVGVFDQLGGDMPGLFGSHQHDNFVQVVASGVRHKSDRPVLARINNGNHDSAVNSESPGWLRLR